MRLLRLTANNEFELVNFINDESLPPYAILSHTWIEGQEVTYDEIVTGTGKEKSGYDKLRFCKEKAGQDHLRLRYFWVDTCCINKRDYFELTTAINSMFRWYQHAARCYVFLLDVPLPHASHPIRSQISWEDAFRRSRWFTRGWTLQELIAPPSVEFFSKSGERLGDKASLEQEIHDITGLPIEVLRGKSPGEFSVDERMGWIATRETTYQEDKAYCLFGVFGVFMPPLYGEGLGNAFRRLRNEIQTSISKLEISCLDPNLLVISEVIRTLWLKLIGRTTAEIKCLRGFYTTDYESHRRRNPDHVVGTCEWFLRHNKYLNWRQQEKSALLWISADPGCGKSVLSSFLIQEFSNPEYQKLLPGDVCYFFFRNDNIEQRTAVHALCAILHQLFVAHPTLIKHAMQDFEKKGSKLMEEFGSLWSIFIAAATGTESKTTICILDGLDECEERTRNMLVDALIKWYSKSTEQQNQSRLKIIATSRPYFEITGRFRALPEIRLNMETEADNSEDIELVIKARLRDFASKRPYLDLKRINGLESNLITRADQTFLWVSVVLGLLEKTIEGSEQEHTDIVQNMSKDLEVVFEEVLRRSPNPKKAKQILHIVVGSTRPLTITEMNIALAIRLGDESLSDLEPRMLPSLADSVKEICGLFVRVMDSKIYLIHETAREFLIGLTESTGRTSETWKHSLYPTESNLILATICIAYLNFREFKDNPLILNTDRPYPEQRIVLRKYLENHDFLEYAARNCAAHFQNSNEDEALRTSFGKLFRTGSPRFYTWYRIYRDSSLESPESPSSVILGSYLGLPKLVQSKLHQGRSVDQSDDSGMTALHWAVEGAQLTLVRLLLKQGADKEAIDEDLETALHKAARKGENEIARLLLYYGAEIDTTDASGSTPLHLAAKTGHEAIFKTLIENGSDIYATDDKLRSTLHLATHSRNVKIIQTLLDLGLELEDMSDENHSVLYEAVDSCCWSWSGESMVEVLLKRGANAKTQDDDGKTPLHNATLYGRDQLARLLLSYGANLHATDTNGFTALHTAAMAGQLVMVPLLVRMGAEIKQMSKSGTPLHLSATGRTHFIGIGTNSCKHEAVARFLIENGAEVDATDESGTTPLMKAGANGHIALIRLLLEAKANIEAQDNNGDSPLHWAAADGQEEAVRVLIQHGAKLDRVDAAGKNALHWATEGGFAAVVKLLLATNEIDPDLQDTEGMTALSYAADAGHEAIAKLLLATNKVDPDTKSCCGQTSLSMAAQGGHEALVELLLDISSVNANSRDSEGRTPLFWAAIGGHELVVKLLLASDRVDPNLQDDFGLTAMSVAETSGHHATAALIRSRLESNTRRRSNRLKRPRNLREG